MYPWKMKCLCLWSKSPQNLWKVRLDKKGKEIALFLKLNRRTNRYRLQRRVDVLNSRGINALYDQLHVYIYFPKQLKDVI